MRFVYNFATAFWTLVVPLVAIIIAAIILNAIGSNNTAWFVSYIGTVMVMLGNLLYIAIWHSRTRWPGTTWRQRLTKVVWYER